MGRSGNAELVGAKLSRTANMAAAHGTGVIGVVLSGLVRDGAMGSRSIGRSGEFVIAQDEASAEQHDMPLAARAIGGPDLVLPL